MTTTRPAWVFDDSEIPDPLGFGERAVRFFDNLKHPLSTAPGQAMALPRFWQRIIKRIYGPRDETGRRIVSRVLIMAPRGSRKTTTISAGLGLLHAVGHERVPRGQVILASGSKDQADFGLEEAKGIVQSTPAMAKRLLLRGEYIEHPEAHSRLRLVSSAGDISSSGSTPAAVFVDEFQYFRDRVLLKALKTGLVKRPGTLFCITMNSGKGQVGPAWEEYTYARRVALGEVDNPAYLPILFEPDSAEADPFDEAVWHHTNPGLSEGWPDIREMRVAAAEAREKPADLEDFKQLNLGFWPDGALAPFVSMGVYDEGAAAFDMDDLAAREVPCWLAVDLSSTIDLTVISACWRDDDRFYLWSWYFVPEDNLDEREARTSMPFRQWAEDGFLTAAGHIVNFDLVTEKIIELCAEFNVREVLFDPKFARQVQPRIVDAGLPALDFPQNFANMAPALLDLERAIVNRQLVHGGHPVNRFCIANAEVKTTHNGQVRILTKPRSRIWLSIDGAVTAAMAVSRASQIEEINWFDRLMASSG